MGYITQKNHFTCVPVAIHNAMVSLGATPPSLKSLIKMCKTRPTGHPDGGGSWITDGIKTMRSLGLSVKKVNRRASKNKIYIFSYLAEPEKELWHCVSTSPEGIHNTYCYSRKRYVKTTKTKWTVKDIEVYEINIRRK